MDKIASAFISLIFQPLIRMNYDYKRIKTYLCKEKTNDGI
jgi:hypothetical protein